jgi:hypothetical protein
MWESFFVDDEEKKLHMTLFLIFVEMLKIICYDKVELHEKLFKRNMSYQCKMLQNV